jgi:hypothetical protein
MPRRNSTVEPRVAIALAVAGPVLDSLHDRLAELTGTARAQLIDDAATAVEAAVTTICSMRLKQN